MPDNFIKTTPLHFVGSSNRGDAYDYTMMRNDCVLIRRHKGTMSGNTYHKGISQGTNPKTFVILSGQIEFLYRHIESDAHQSQLINKPSIIEVQPYVTHAVKALTDIVMLECNSIAEIEKDRYRLDVIQEALL